MTIKYVVKELKQLTHEEIRLCELEDEMERIKSNIKDYSRIIEKHRKRYTELQKEFNALITKTSEKL